MKVSEGDVVRTSSGKVAKVYSIGLAIGNLFDKDNIVNLNDGTFCFESDIIEIVSKEIKNGKY